MMSEKHFKSRDLLGEFARLSSLVTGFARSESALFRRAMGVALVLWVVAGMAAAAEPVLVAPVYRIGPNDVVRVQVFGEEDLTVESKVGGDGAINFPLLGAVPVAGKTARELQEFLVIRLAEGYVRSPRVTVLMVRYRNFYVSGEVKTPGGYPYEAGLTVRKALSLAGGVTEKAETKAISVTRVAGDRTETIRLGGEGLVLPDDILTVGQMQRFYVTGEVARPGRYPYEEQLTIKKALTLAGGFTEKADSAAVKVTRLSDATVKTMAVGVDEVVYPDDLIVVESQNRRIYVSGEVKTPGGYLYESSLTLQKALSMGGGFTEKADKAEITVNRLQDGAVRVLTLDAQALLMPDDEIVVPQLRKVFVEGEVKRPGHFQYERGMTVHMAIAMAGGFTDKAAKKSTEVLRIINGREHTIEVGLDTLILPADIVMVPQRFF
jgi:polysaccharide export outer membrane protein